MSYIIPRTPEDRLRLSQAYTRVFKTGESTQEDRNAVMIDILSFSGYFSVSPEGSNLERKEGARSVGGMVFSMTNMPDSERERLYNATRERDIEEQTYG